MIFLDIQTKEESNWNMLCGSDFKSGANKDDILEILQIV